MQSFKQKNYQLALREAFIKIDENLKSPQGLKDIKRYTAKDDGNQNSLFGRPETDNIAMYTGCTACACIVTDTEVICANSGDSRMVL